MRVERSRPLRGRLVVKLDAVGDRTTAERLRGKPLTVPRASVMPLPEGTYYHFQVLDISVWTDQGEYLGEVKEILSTPGNDVYVVRGPGGREVLVPALQGVIIEVRPDEGRMVVRLPEEI